MWDDSGNVDSVLVLKSCDGNASVPLRRRGGRKLTSQYHGQRPHQCFWSRCNLKSLADKSLETLTLQAGGAHGLENWKPRNLTYSDIMTSWLLLPPPGLPASRFLCFIPLVLPEQSFYILNLINGKAFPPISPPLSSKPYMLEDPQDSSLEAFSFYFHSFH